MKAKHLALTATILGMLFVACKQEKTLDNYMIGNWETSYIKIEYPTYQSSDSTFVFEDDFSKPNSGKAQSNYKKDGTFTAWFLQPDGKKVGESGGKWKTKGDSLFVDYPYLGKNVQAWYKIEQTQEGFKGTVIYDWDNDGENDDHLIMRSKKLK